MQFHHYIEKNTSLADFLKPSFSNLQLEKFGLYKNQLTFKQRVELGHNLVLNANYQKILGKDIVALDKFQLSSKQYEAIKNIFLQYSGICADYIEYICIMAQKRYKQVDANNFHAIVNFVGIKLFLLNKYLLEPNMHNEYTPICATETKYLKQIQQKVQSIIIGAKIDPKTYNFKNRNFAYMTYISRLLMLKYVESLAFITKDFYELTNIKPLDQNIMRNLCCEVKNLAVDASFLLIHQCYFDYVKSYAKLISNSTIKITPERILYSIDYSKIIIAFLPKIGLFHAFFFAYIASLGISFTSFGVSIGILILSLTGITWGLFSWRKRRKIKQIERLWYYLSCHRLFGHQMLETNDTANIRAKHRLLAIENTHIPAKYKTSINHIIKDLHEKYLYAQTILTAVKD